MTQITPIQISMPYKLGITNCYLIEEGGSYFLIDTGSSNQRLELEKKLAEAGCDPGNLKLIILTHGDFDHTGNAAYLRQKFGTRIAMHRDDSGMAERGDMFVNRKQPNPIIRKILPALSGFGKNQRFTPDLCLEDGQDLSEYHLNATVLSIPGHSQGSIGILLAGGDLFCGDLLENLKNPCLGSIMDDIPTANASLEKLKGYEIGMVYPGHGKPFLMAQFLSAN